MLEKRALIFGYAGISGDENYCAGVLKDIENYKNYLKSFHGGCWEDSEIDSCNDVSKDSLLKAIAEVSQTCDYSVVIFSGHGQYNSDYEETEIEINNSETVLEHELYTVCDRQLIILDCCRKPTKILIQDSINKSLSFGMESFSVLDKDYYKSEFDRQLNSSVKGEIKVYSCSVGQFSSDNSEKGGVFSYSFLKNAVSDEDLTVSELFFKTKKYLEGRAEQIPVIEKPKSGMSFPFYIA